MKKIIFLFIIFLNIQYAFCQMLKTFSAEFTRETIERNKKERVEGKIYYRSDFKELIFCVSDPINQWMILKGNETLIYYPDSRQAFKINSQIPSIMPFFEATLAAIDEDCSLKKMGYEFSHYERKGDILISYWKPDKKLSKIFGECILAYQRNQLIYLEMKGPNSQSFSRIEYANYIKHENIYFPLEIMIIKKKHSDNGMEKIIYKNPVFNSPLPLEVINFKIPEATIIKEIHL